MNNKTLSIMALALSLSFANISVSQADGHMHNNLGNMISGMINDGMMNSGMMNSGMMNGGMMSGGMMYGGMMFSQLNLTAEQQQKIQAIMETTMASARNGQSMMSLMQAHMTEAQALLNSPTFNESKAREMLNKLQTLMVDRQVQMLQAHHQAFQVLTEPQKAQVNTLMSEHLGLMQQYMKGFQQ
jgi:periplasmic protein CpxP/Spy